MIKITVSIDVSSLKQAETFYIEALGCKKIRDQGSNMVVLGTENCDIYLQEKEAGTKPIPSSEIVRDYNRHWTPIHLDFITENIDEVVTAAEVLQLVMCCFLQFHKLQKYVRIYS